LGFCWGFLFRVQTEFFSNPDHNLLQLSVINDQREATHHQPIPKLNPLKGIKCFPQDHKEGKGRTQARKDSKFQQGWKTEIEAKERYGLDQRPFLGLILKIKNTVNSLQNHSGPLSSTDVYLEIKLGALE
jgi:hypothetical protein